MCSSKLREREVSGTSGMRNCEHGRNHELINSILMLVVSSVRYGTI